MKNYEMTSFEKLRERLLILEEICDFLEEKAEEQRNILSEIDSEYTTTERISIVKRTRESYKKNIYIGIINKIHSFMDDFTVI